MVEILSLNGAWALSQAGSEEHIPATVPGCVHMDLQSAGKLEDPFYRDNERKQYWIGETDWKYTRTFEFTPDQLKRDRVLLRCHGLDTLATIQINGHTVATANNMYRTWEFDIKDVLVEGENTIAIVFDAPMPFLRKAEAEKGILPTWSVGDHRLNAGSWIRKMPSNFGWDWGPQLVTSGIWRDIELVLFDTARLSDVLVQQHHNDGKVTLEIDCKVEQLGDAALTGACAVVLADETIAHADMAFDGDSAHAEIVIANPALWYPAGLGEQPLYTVTVTLNAGRNPLDTWKKQIGLRVLELVLEQDEWGESFHFAANGIPFFAKGANWIPAAPFEPALTPEDYDRLLSDAVAANMNMLRVWGGGLYEADIFYDLCDKYGLCVWQDFVFACGTYPAFDEEFMANVRSEAEDNVRRLRHHPSLVLWCGNNELEQGLVGDEWTPSTMSWRDYGKLFDELLPSIVLQLDPQRQYWPASPHSPHGDRNDWMNPQWGDTHLWGVWHAKEPFEWYRTCEHRFVSEFGLQSFPEPETIARFTEPEDRNITSYVMEYHQRSGIGNSTIIHYMLDWFKLPTSFESVIWLSQVLQGLAIKYAVEGWRRNMPRQMGALYWQLNDLWPAPSWSSIDVYGRWKALHYLARRFFAPVLITGLEDIAQSTVEIHITSEALQEQTGTVKWLLTTTGGEILQQAEIAVTILPQQNNLVTTLELHEAVQAQSAHDVLLWLELYSASGELVSDNLVTFARPKHLNLTAANIQAHVQQVGDELFAVTLTSDVPALFVWLELPNTNARFSDNFVHLRAHHPVTIEIAAAGPKLDATAVQTQLRVNSLVDTYSG